jgi:hypothetical protein
MDAKNLAKDVKEMNVVTMILMEMLLALFQSIEELDGDSEFDKEIIEDLSVVLGEAFIESVDKIDKGCGKCLDGIKWDLIFRQFVSHDKSKQSNNRVKLGTYATQVVRQTIEGRKRHEGDNNSAPTE